MDKKFILILAFFLVLGLNPSVSIQNGSLDSIHDQVNENQINNVNDTLATLNGSNDVYVSTEGKDSNDGSLFNPFQSLSKAMIEVNDGGTIHIANGVYKGNLNRNLTISKNMKMTRDEFSFMIV